jgi:hypothetical protein
VLAFAADHKGEVEAYVAKPGLITKKGAIMTSLTAMALKWMGIVPNVDIEHVAAAMLELVVRGSTTDTLLNDDLRKLGQKVVLDNSQE